MFLLIKYGTHYVNISAHSGILRLASSAHPSLDTQETSCPSHFPPICAHLSRELATLQQRWVSAISSAKTKTKSVFFQLWDIREGMCKQTFPGHESDINAVTVSALKHGMPATASLTESRFVSVLSKWFCICNWFWWCNLSVVRHPSWSGTSHVFTR